MYHGDNSLSNIGTQIAYESEKKGKIDEERSRQRRKDDFYGRMTFPREGNERCWSLSPHDNWSSIKMFVMLLVGYGNANIDYKLRYP